MAKLSSKLSSFFCLSAKSRSKVSCDKIKGLFFYLDDASRQAATKKSLFLNLFAMRERKGKRGNRLMRNRMDNCLSFLADEISGLARCFDKISARSFGRRRYRRGPCFSCNLHYPDAIMHDRSRETHTSTYLNGILLSIIRSDSNGG